ncbi:MAG: hypothetical protein GF383_10325 [Candidatus Lokiarchaeota archaeon]|nr:hypothetical protein [Candidatus Lokiarchaeota archaeon]MBD3340952.1 hypothetical protein [Candidatus Lokiarchaeota archaeon]
MRISERQSKREKNINLINFCPICDNFLRIKKKADGSVITICICGYSKVISIAKRKIKRPYSCQVCGKRFVELRSLIQHQKDKTHDVNDIYLRYLKQGLSLDQMINIEDSRKLPRKLNRNVVLSFLVKKKANFQCQICKVLGTDKQDSRIEAHHKIPLSQGGKDISTNLIVLCHKHHKQIHQGTLDTNILNF